MTYDLEKWRHDLKNQLGIILGLTEILGNEMDGANPRRADIQEIHAAAVRALELISQLNDAGIGEA